MVSPTSPNSDSKSGKSQFGEYFKNYLHFIQLKEVLTLLVAVNIVKEKRKLAR
jgi:hypothetical protein